MAMKPRGGRKPVMHVGEAMACGAPIVLSRTPVFEEIVAATLAMSIRWTLKALACDAPAL